MTPAPDGPEIGAPGTPAFLEPYRYPSPERLKLYASLLALLVLSTRLGRARTPGPGLRDDLGVRETLRRSSFARVMFMDIGALSTLGALFLTLRGRTRLRGPAALASLFVGSFALLPALAYEDWKALQERERVGRGRRGTNRPS